MFVRTLYGPSPNACDQPRGVLQLAAALAKTLAKQLSKKKSAPKVDEEEEPEAPSNVIDLMAALKKSLEVSRIRRERPANWPSGGPMARCGLAPLTWSSRTWSRTLSSV